MNIKNSPCVSRYTQVKKRDDNDIKGRKQERKRKRNKNGDYKVKKKIIQIRRDCETARRRDEIWHKCPID
jgi:hypothetical protein